MIGFLAMLAALVPAQASVSNTSDRSRPAESLSSPADWVTADDYPAAALRAGAQGTSGVQFRVLPSGRVSGCEVTDSSGSELLDAMSCALVTTRARYRPELDTSGRAVESASKTLRFTWRLPDEESAAPEFRFGIPFRLEVQVDVNVDGNVTDCTIIARNGPVPLPPGDPCLEIRASNDVSPYRDASGKAVASRMTFVTSLSYAPR
ncbi:MAG TPA: energy transducer TonB [Sphingomonas sp.]|jgi:protein TonB|uniref:energy transducer TonB n=1 Tax=Sphingomonas sp. TaxID=28214 RepID=UPI002EDB1FF7